MNMKSCKSAVFFIGILAMLSSMLASTESRAEEAEKYYRIKLLVESSTDWTTIKFLPPWDKDIHIVETKIIKPRKNQDQVKIKGFHIAGQSLDDTPKEVEYIVYFKAQVEDLECIITKGDIGTTEVKVYNICSEKAYRVGTYTNAETTGHPNPYRFKISIKKLSKYGPVEFTPSQRGS